jgi:hypothetical protein
MGSVDEAVRHEYQRGMSMTSSPTPTKLNQVDIQIDELIQTVHVLRERLHELESRLTPVLRPPLVQEELKATPDERIVPLAEKIRDIRHMVQGSLGLIGEVQDRLEI